MTALVGFMPRGPRGSYVGKVHSVSYHRNGVSGQGFHCVSFTLNDAESPNDGDRLSAVVCDSECDDAVGAVCVFVTHPDPGVSFRGDNFHEALRKIVKSARCEHEVTP